MNFRIFDRLRFALWRISTPFFLRFNGVCSSGRVRLVGFPLVKNRGAISLGAGCDLRSLSGYTAMGVIQRCLLNTLQSESVIKIGDQCGISGAVICAKERIDLGDRVQVGSGAVICDTDFHSMEHEVRGGADDLSLADAKPVSIGDDCFIGARAMILKGVSVGARSIIGAGAVVTKDVPADVVVAGNPARVVRELIK